MAEPAQVTPFIRKRKPRIQPSELLPIAGGPIAPWTLVLSEHMTELLEAGEINITDPELWESTARKFQMTIGGGPGYHNMVTVLNERHTLFGWFSVRAISDNQVTLDPIIPLTWFGPDVKEPVPGTNLKPKWNVGRKGWDVVRVSDGRVVQEGSKFKTTEMALAWIKEYGKQFGT